MVFTFAVNSARKYLVNCTAHGINGYQRKPGQNAHWDWLNSPEAETLTV